MAEAPPVGELNRLTSGLRLVGDRLEKLERSLNPDVILLKLDHLQEAIEGVQKSVDKINSRVAKNETSVSHHETRIRMMEEFCQERVKPALEVIADNRTQIAVQAAKYGAGGLGIGGGIALILWIISLVTGQPLPSP